MTAVAIETSVLESLDFEIGCQAITVSRVLPGMPVTGTCTDVATYTATIHDLRTCEWVEKFLCWSHASRGYHDDCDECGMVPRIKDCKHLGAS